MVKGLIKAGQPPADRVEQTSAKKTQKNDSSRFDSLLSSSSRGIRKPKPSGDSQAPALSLKSKLNPNGVLLPEMKESLVKRKPELSLGRKSLADRKKPVDDSENALADMKASAAGKNRPATDESAEMNPALAEAAAKEQQAELVRNQLRNQESRSGEQELKPIIAEDNGKKELSSSTEKRTVTIVDQRSRLSVKAENSRENSTGGGQQGKEEGQNRDFAAVLRNRTQDHHRVQHNVSEEVMVIRETDISAEGGGGKSQAPVLRTHGSMLDRYLKNQGSASIARKVSFVMKDNNEGEIRLVLKPESLGRVRIKLNLSENHITGRIIVENNSVRQVFQDNLNQISRLLEEQGYETASLEVAVEDHGERQQGEENGDGRQPFFSERLRDLDSSVPVSPQYASETSGLNMIA